MSEPDDELVERLAALVVAVREALAAARAAGGLTVDDRARVEQLRTRLGALYVSLAFALSEDDAEALRAILTPPAGSA